jgi:hypothetical protein
MRITDMMIRIRDKGIDWDWRPGLNVSTESVGEVDRRRVVIQSEEQV